MGEEADVDLVTSTSRKRANRLSIGAILVTPSVIFKVAAVVCAVFVAVAGWVWQAARYPDRAEFEQFKVEIGERLDTVNAKVLDILIEQERLRGIVERGKP